MSRCHLKNFGPRFSKQVLLFEIFSFKNCKIDLQSGPKSVGNSVLSTIYLTTAWWLQLVQLLEHFQMIEWLLYCKTMHNLWMMIDDYCGLTDNWGTAWWLLDHFLRLKHMLNSLVCLSKRCCCCQFFKMWACLKNSLCF